MTPDVPSPSPQFLPPPVPRVRPRVVAPTAPPAPPVSAHSEPESHDTAPSGFPATVFRRPAPASLKDEHATADFSHGLSHPVEHSENATASAASLTAENGGDTRTPLSPGSVLGDYTIISKIGKGGFGITYSARHNVTGNGVVIKEHMPEGLAYREVGESCITRTSSAQENRFRRTLDEFLTEINILRALSHPGIVPILSFFEANDTAYYVMPFIVGEPLNREEPITMDATRRASAAIRLKHLTDVLLTTLEYLQKHNVVHRDIKPENIIVTGEGNPVLLDFGSARQMYPGKIHTNVYTPAYAAPEQITAADDADVSRRMGPWTDIYSLGATLYYLITRMLPPRSDTRLHAAPDPYRPLAERGDLQELYGHTFLQAIDRALVLSPKDRWQSAADWHHAITEGVLPPDPKLQRRLRNVIIIGTAAIAVLGGLCGLAFYQQKQIMDLTQIGLGLTENVIFNFNEQIADIPGSTELQAQLADRLQNYLSSMSAHGAGDRGKLEHTITAARYTLSTVQLAQGRLEEAESSQQMVIELINRHLDSSGEDSARRRFLLAKTHRDRAELFRRRNDKQQEGEQHELALALLRQLHSEEPENIDYACALGEALCTHARFEQRIRDKVQEKEHPHLNESLQLFEKLFAAYHDNKAVLTGLAYALQYSAEAAMNREDFSTAIAYLTRERLIFEGLTQAEPLRLSYMRGYASALAASGNLFKRMSYTTASGNEEARAESNAFARQAYDSEIEQVQKLRAFDPTDTNYDAMLCEAYNNKASVLISAGMGEEAVNTCTRLLELTTELLARSPQNTDYELQQAGAYLWRSRAARRCGVRTATEQSDLESYRGIVDKLFRQAPEDMNLRFALITGNKDAAELALEHGEKDAARTVLSEADNLLKDFLKTNPEHTLLGELQKEIRTLLSRCETENP